MYRGNTGAYSQMVERLDPTWPMPSSRSVRRRRCYGFASVWRGARSSASSRIVLPAGLKMVSVPFLGEPALLPTGPLMLCAALGAPVVLFFGVRTGDGLPGSFRTVRDRIVLQRSRRAEDVAGWVSRYAERLEAYCRIYPFNWFNFYDFWGSPGHMRLHRRRFGLLLLAILLAWGPLAAVEGHRQQRPQAAIDELMRMLAGVPRAVPAFVEVKVLAMLTRPLHATGRLRIGGRLVWRRSRWNPGRRASWWTATAHPHRRVRARHAPSTWTANRRSGPGRRRTRHTVGRSCCAAAILHGDHDGRWRTGT